MFSIDVMSTWYYFNVCYALNQCLMQCFVMFVLFKSQCFPCVNTMFSTNTHLIYIITKIKRRNLFMTNFIMRTAIRIDYVERKVILIFLQIWLSHRRRVDMNWKTMQNVFWWILRTVFLAMQHICAILVLQLKVKLTPLC